MRVLAGIDERKVRRMIALATGGVKKERGMKKVGKQRIDEALRRR